MSFCECEEPLCFIGSFTCEICGKKIQSVIEEYNRYCCPKCGEILPYNQIEHDLRRHNP